MKARAEQFVQWMDDTGWGWRQWVMQLLIVVVTAAWVVPLVMISGR